MGNKAVVVGQLLPLTFSLLEKFIISAKVNVVNIGGD